MTPDDAIELLVEVLEHLQERHSVGLGARLKPLLREASGGEFDEQQLGYRSFKDFLQEAASRGLVTLLIDPAHGNDIIARLVDTSTGPLTQEEAFQLLSSSVDDLRRRGRSTKAAGLKPLLQNRSRGHFDERSYGYATFKEFLEAAAAESAISLVRVPNDLEALPFKGSVGQPTVNQGAQPPKRRPSRSLSFGDLNFGFSSAHAESVRDPNLLLDGFFDPNGIAKKIRDGQPFIVIGQKGSGKSAIAEHLFLEARDSHDLFVDLVDLREFPYHVLGDIGGDPSSPPLVKVGWTWLLLVRLMEKLLEDQGASNKSLASLKDASKQLKKLGLVPSDSFRQLGLSSAEISLKGGLPPFVSGAISASTGGQSRELSADRAAGTLLNRIAEYSSPNRHLMIIDGLDELLSPQRDIFTALAALLDCVEDLNTTFFRAQSPVKIVLLCRRELYEKIPSLNKNKLRQDFGLTLDWYSARYVKSPLIGLAKHRARLSGLEGNPFELLPPKVGVRAAAGARDRVNTTDFILSHTRSTPRDLVNIFAAIQREAGGDRVTGQMIRDAMTGYSVDYFLPEIKDELQGYFSPEDVETLVGLLGGLGKRDFAVSDLLGLAERRDIDTDLAQAGIAALFECSAVGQVRSIDGRARHLFRFRDRALAIDPKRVMIIHRGAWPAFSIPSEEFVSAHEV